MARRQRQADRFREVEISPSSCPAKAGHAVNTCCARSLCLRLLGRPPSRAMTKVGYSANVDSRQESIHGEPMRKVLIAAAIAAVFALPVSAQAQKPETTKVRLAVGGKSSLYYLPLTITERLGYFKDAGLDVEISDFAGGAESLQIGRASCRGR